jgi:hypothetical protein
MSARRTERSCIFADLPATTTYCVTAGAKADDEKVAAFPAYLNDTPDNAHRSVSIDTSNTLS